MWRLFASLMLSVAMGAQALQVVSDADLAGIVGHDGIDLAMPVLNVAMDALNWGTGNGLSTTQTGNMMQQWSGLGVQGGAIDLNLSQGSQTTSAVLDISLQAQNLNFSAVSVSSSVWDGSASSLLTATTPTGAQPLFNYQLGQVSLQGLNYILSQGFTDQSNATLLTQDGLSVQRAACSNTCVNINNPSWSDTQNGTSFAATNVQWQNLSAVKVSIAAASASTLSSWEQQDANLASVVGSNTSQGGLLLSIGAYTATEVVTGASGTGGTGNSTRSISQPATMIFLSNKATPAQVLNGLVQLSDALALPPVLGPKGVYP